MARPKAPEAAIEDVLTRSARRCALCFGLDGSLARAQGQIAHVDRNPSNNAVDNLAFLCLPHHDEYDSRPSQSKGFTERELRSYRNRLYDAIAAGLHHASDATAPSPTIDPSVLDHDRGAFRQLDELLSELHLENFRYDLEYDASYRLEDNRIVGNFVHHARRESGRYILADLNDVLDQLVEALDQLDDFLAEHFFPYPPGQAKRCCLHPELDCDRENLAPSKKTDAKFKHHETQLLTHTRRVAEQYAEYRRTIKRTLAI